MSAPCPPRSRKLVTGRPSSASGTWGTTNRNTCPCSVDSTSKYGHYNGALDYFTHMRDGGHDWHKNDRRNDDEGYTTDLIARQAVRIIAEHEKVRPLFLYVPFNAPHTPLQAPQRHLDRYADWPNKQRATSPGESPLAEFGRDRSVLPG